MSFEKLAKMNQELNRLSAIDRDSFFGRLEILECACEEKHAMINERWRKLGRYGNIVVPSAFNAALQTMKEDYGFTKEEMTELLNWVKGQAASYGNPDQAVAGVLLGAFIKTNY